MAMMAQHTEREQKKVVSIVVTNTISYLCQNTINTLFIIINCGIWFICRERHGKMFIILNLLQYIVKKLFAFPHKPLSLSSCHY